MSDLPENWINTTIGEVTEKPQYGWTTKSAVTGNTHLVRTTDITKGKIDWDTVPFCTEEPDQISKYLLKDGDILISRAGSVGFSILMNSPINAIFASYLIRFKPLIINKYVSYFLQSPGYWKCITESKLGIAVQNVNATRLSKIALPLPPLPEQQRIVARIEKLFTKLNAGVAALKKAKALLKQHRQSVLKAAVEGRLTEEWRRENANQIEPASALLERIQVERKQRLGKKYKPPKPIDTINLPKLPDGWVWVKLGSICDDVIKVQPKDKPDVKFTYLDIASINNSINKITAPKYYLGIDAPSRARQIVKTGDILFSTVRTYLKNIALVEREYDGQIASTGFCVIRPIIVYNKYIFTLIFHKDFLNSLSKIQRGTSYPAVRNSDVFNQFIPLPPIEEQKKTIEECSRLFSITDEIDFIIESELKRSHSLRQSILKRAFEGKLVPQDPADEPASVLLERIRAEKEKQL